MLCRVLRSPIIIILVRLKRDDTVARAAVPVQYTRLCAYRLLALRSEAHAAACQLMTSQLSDPLLCLSFFFLVLLLLKQGTGREATPVPFCPPQIPHGLPKERELYLKTQSVSRSKHTVSVIKTSQLMLYREIIAVCSEIHINTLCGQNVQLLNVKPAGTYSNHWAIGD
jgi:hypothetical protein